jgi:hypothetical protein
MSKSQREPWGFDRNMNDFINLINPAPWERHDWVGELVSVGGCSTTDFTRDDVEEVVQYGSTDQTDWDGESAGIVKLRDGRFAAWETDWGPTGDGFCQDAYGGTTDIVFARSEADAFRALTDRGRALLAPIDVGLHLAAFFSAWRGPLDISRGRIVDAETLAVWRDQIEEAGLLPLDSK